MNVTIDKLDNFGRGICYVNDKICFVENALPGETVKIDIITDNKKYYEAKVIDYLLKSSNRIEEECSYSSICGGCQLNHICYNDENTFKMNKIKEIIHKYALLDTSIIEPIVYNGRDYYRNKIVLHGDGEKLGLFQNETNSIIPIQQCLLVNDKINEIIRFLNYNNKGIEEAIIKTSNDNSQVMISLKGMIDKIEVLSTMCDVFIMNGSYMTSKDSIITNVGSKKYYEGIRSFFQVNNTLTELLYDEVLNVVKERHYHSVLDLYCGTGSIGIYISDVVDKIIGVDNNESNIMDAKKNKELNGVQNIDFICDKVENCIESFENIDLVIVDPPRAGLDTKTRETLKKIHSKTIVYVSCDIITLARDLKDLKESYNVIKIKPFNMFPRTYHCESITVLERR